MAEESLCEEMLLAAATHRFTDATNGVLKHPECNTPNNNLCASDIKDCRELSATHLREDSQDSVESGNTTTSQGNW